MHSFIPFSIYLALTIHTQAAPTHHNPRRTPARVTVSCVEELGDVHSESTYVKRDLGFQGQIGQYVLLTYGDTLYGDADYTDTWRGMTSDSVALATHNPLIVVDPDLNANGYPKQFCPVIEHYGEDMSTCALGITNVVETYQGQGNTLTTTTVVRADLSRHPLLPPQPPA